MDGFEVQKRVREEFKLPLIMVSSDDREQVILKALKLGAVHYIVKPVCFNDVKDLWNYVVVANKSWKEIGFSEEIESVGEKSGETAVFDGNTTDDDHDKENFKRNRSAKEGNAPKKAKVVWTQELQARFLESVHFIGLEKAVPKTILEVMNVEGLTRENVASHLQKYRQFLRRVAARISLSKSDPMDKSKMPRSTFRHSTRPSIFQQQRPLYGQNLGINRGNPLIRGGANDHVVSASNSVPSLGYRSQPFLPNSQYQAPEPASFIGYRNTTFPPANCNLPSVNGFGFQANNVQSNWSTIPRDIPFTSGSNANNGLEAQAISTSLPNNLCGIYNNYGTIAAGLQYNDNFNNASWNGTLGFVNGSNNLIINHNNYGGIPITSVNSVGLAGRMGTNPNPNPNPMVFNGDDWPNSSTSGVNSNNFVGLFLNQNEHHQNMDDNVSLADNLMFGPDDFSGIEDSSSVGFDGVANLDTAASTSNVFDNASSKHLQNEDFGILHGILYDDNNLDIVNQKEDIPAVNSEMNLENASLNKECNDQNSNRELVEEPEFDWLDLLDPNTIIENVSMDEEWEHFMDSFDN